MVTARAAISSPVPGTGSRAPVSRAVISSSRRRMRATGCKAAPVSSQPPSPAVSTARGAAITRARRARASAVSATSVGTATTAMAGCARKRASLAITRSRSASMTAVKVSGPAAARRSWAGESRGAAPSRPDEYSWGRPGLRTWLTCSAAGD